MKQNSTQQSNDSLGDQLYSIFILEFQNRGIEYFNWISSFPDLTEGTLFADAPLSLVKRLAANPSIISILLSQKPVLAIENLIFSEDNDATVKFLTDFIDEITLNVKLRNPDLYARNEEIFKDQLDKIVKAQTEMNDQEAADFKAVNERYGYMFLTLHYLRKIGYNYAAKERNNQA